MTKPEFTMDSKGNYIVICNSYEQMRMFEAYYNKQRRTKLKLEEKLRKMSLVVE